MTMIPRALNAPLSWIGLMRVSEHEAALTDAADRRCQLIDECDTTAKARDDWKAKHASVVSKLERATTDLAAATETIGDFKIAYDRMEADRNNWRDQAMRDEPDALLWRAARLKRRGNK